MVKRILFDLDNTIILWKDAYVDVLRNLTKEYQIETYCDQIDQIIDSEEKKRDVLTKEFLLEDINTACDLKLPMTFVEELLIRQKECAEGKDEKLISLFSDLAKKYELVLLTNYFKETQMGRLEKLGILPYFQACYGCEDGKLKPNREAFERAIKPYQKEECIVIGDSDVFDIHAALSLGIPVIQVDLTKTKKKDKNYPVINDLEELRNYL